MLIAYDKEKFKISLKKNPWGPEKLATYFVKKFVIIWCAHIFMD